MKQYFIYSGQIKGVASGTTTPISIRIGEEDFEVRKITGTATYPADIVVSITITNSSKVLMNITIPWNDFIGTAQLPSIAENLSFKCNNDLLINITNNNANPTDAQISFIGNKLLK